MVVTAIASIPGLDGVLLGHPEVLLVEIAAIALVSTLWSWRLLAVLNPAPRTSQPTAVASRPVAEWLGVSRG